MAKDILTKKELEVINKKITGEKITQQDSNYLSRYIRPKLKKISEIESKKLLNLISYNQKKNSIENKIKKTVLEELFSKNIHSIVLYGSSIQSNYAKYNDIDILIITNQKLWTSLGEKYKIISDLNKKLKNWGVSSDIEIYDKKTFYKSYPENPSLIYQLKDKKIIYGNLNLNKKISIPKINLRTKLDYSILDNDSKGIEIYKAIRNAILITLIMDKKIDNEELINTIRNEIGLNLLEKLKDNKETKLERKIALLYLNNLINETIIKLGGAKWERIVL